MNIEFTGRHIEVTPALREHVETHFERIKHLFDGKPAKAHVIIEVERGRHRSEIVINWRNEVLKAESRISDMYLSLSQSIDKIEKQARKLKDKVIDKSHKAAKAAVIAAPNETAPKMAAEPKIVEATRLIAKPMTTDEAAMVLDANEQPFFVFRNARDSQMAVIFRRADGNYGLIHA